MHISPSIFKAYDVRGIVPSTLNADVARALGRAFGMAAREAQQTTVAVGRDFGDVSPLRGVILGGDSHSYGVAVTLVPTG